MLLSQESFQASLAAQILPLGNKTVPMMSVVLTFAFVKDFLVH
jgi:hypothetical protein